jgi:hypothetical protein
VALKNERLADQRRIATLQTKPGGSASRLGQVGQRPDRGLRSVVHIDLAQQAVEVNLRLGFSHAEVFGDYFVRVPLKYEAKHLRLTGREVCGVGHRCGATYWLRGILFKLWH